MVSDRRPIGAHETLHAAEQSFWATAPLPVAELGMRLVPSSPSYLEDVLRASWAVLLLATHVELARRRAIGAAIDARRVSEALTHASPGKIARLLHELAPTGEAWRWDLVDDRMTPLARLLRRPRLDTKEAVEAIAQLRNAWAHHDALPAAPEVCASALEATVKALISTHAHLASSRLIYTERVERFGKDERYVAVALEGPVPAPLRRGEWQPGWPGMPQGRVYLQRRGSSDLLDLHPFVLFDGQQCHLLAEVKVDRRRARGTWWSALRSDSRPDVSGDAAEDLDQALPIAADADEQTYVDALSSFNESSRPASPSGGRDLSARWFLGLGAVAVALVGVCGMTALGGMLWTARTAPLGGAEVAPAVASPAAPLCASGTSSTATGDIPRWLTGLDVRWGEPVAAFDSRCGPRAPDPDLAACSIAAGRDLTSSGVSGLPGLRSAASAFDTRSGMFEVTIRSTATPGDIASIVTARYGVPSSVEGQRHVWTEGDVRISLAGSPGGATGSVLVARYLPLSQTFFADRPRFCPR